VSSLILLVIVAAWAVVLVPMLLNRHESASELRSVDRFATAMRVLARRTTASGDRRYVVVPRRPQSTPSIVVNGTSPWVEQADDSGSDSDAESRPSRPGTVERDVAASDVAAVRVRIAARRRRVLLSLAVVAAVFVPLAVLVSSRWWTVQVPGDLLLVLYVMHLRREAARARSRRLRAATRARRAARQAAAARSVPPAYARAPAPPADLVTPPGAVVIERQEDGSWIPVPVPLPTYVNAPLGPPAPTAPPPAAAAAAAATGLSADEELDRRLDEMERRLAVND
jgi:hypothetical protein